MKYPYFLLLMSTGMLSGQESAEPAAVVATTQVAEAKQHIAASAAALQQLHATLCKLKTAADIKAALPEMEKAIADYDAAMEAVPENWSPAPGDLMDWRAAHKDLRTLCTKDSFTELVWDNDALKYYLLLKSAYLPCYLYEETAEYMMMTTSSPGEEPDAAMLPHCDKVRALAADKHAAFMQAHADVYAGGNGADEASAIILRPIAEGTGGQSADNEEERSLIAAYMHAVYPRFNSGYSFVQASPDGSLYTIMTQYPGVYENADGELRLISFYVYFCTDLPDKKE